jgi:hypothetical protein
MYINVFVTDRSIQNAKDEEKDTSGNAVYSGFNFLNVFSIQHLDSFISVSV